MFSQFASLRFVATWTDETVPHLRLYGIYAGFDSRRLHLKMQVRVLSNNRIRLVKRLSIRIEVMLGR
jgi:hypothetical protein